MKKALDCFDPIAEEVLVDGWLHDILEEYCIFLENLCFLSFTKLIEIARRTKVHRASTSVKQFKAVLIS